jgi:transposase-like protein
MSMFSKLFSAKPVNVKRTIQPQNFVECLEATRVWNAQAMYQMDIDLNDETIKSTMNTLVTCPYCSESYYFGDALGFSDGRFTVECPMCQVSPSEDSSEEYVA